MVVHGWERGAHVHRRGGGKHARIFSSVASAAADGRGTLHTGVRACHQRGAAEDAAIEVLCTKKGSREKTTAGAWVQEIK